MLPAYLISLMCASVAAIPQETASAVQEVATTPAAYEEAIEIDEAEVEELYRYIEQYVEEHPEEVYDALYPEEAYAESYDAEPYQVEEDSYEEVYPEEDAYPVEKPTSTECPCDASKPKSKCPCTKSAPAAEPTKTPCTKSAAVPTSYTTPCAGTPTPDATSTAEETYGVYSSGEKLSASIFGFLALALF